LLVQAVRVRTLITTLTGALVLATGAAGCGDDTSDLPPPAPSPPPGSSGEASPDLELSPAEAEAVAEARAKFDEFMTAYIEVSTADIPTADQAEALFFRVDEHLAGLLSQELRTEIVDRWSEQRTVDGELNWNYVRTIDIDLNRVVDGSVLPRVNLLYCIDATRWVVVNALTRQPTGDEGVRQFWRYALSWSDNWFDQQLEGWRVVEREAMETRSC
jgi:hypothetical protein